MCVYRLLESLTQTHKQKLEQLVLKEARNLKLYFCFWSDRRKALYTTSAYLFFFFVFNPAEKGWSDVDSQPLHCLQLSACFGIKKKSQTKLTMTESTKERSVSKAPKTVKVLCWSGTICLSSTTSTNRCVCLCVYSYICVHCTVVHQ